MKDMRPVLKNLRPVLKNHRRILLAVSGGGDSVAMLHFFAALSDFPELHVATVDHGLRPASADEAEFVAKLADRFGTPHSTLTWNPPESASSEDARLARHDLLAHHAIDIGATAIAFAHTLDDQAETIVMRSRRMTPESGTRGLAGIPEWATHAVAPNQSVCLLRPFLAVRRSELRQYLRKQEFHWIDDPGNDDPSSERVRMRKALGEGKAHPSPTSIAQLAALSSRTRRWLNLKTSLWLEDNLTVRRDGSISLAAANTPSLIAENAFATLICVAGGLDHRPSSSKLVELINAFQSHSPLRRNVGRALVSIDASGAHFIRENRNVAETTESGAVDGRFFVTEDGEKLPFISALERFRPLSDNSLYNTIQAGLYEAARTPVDA